MSIATANPTTTPNKNPRSTRSASVPPFVIAENRFVDPFQSCNVSVGARISVMRCEVGLSVKVVGVGAGAIIDTGRFWSAAMFV